MPRKKKESTGEVDPFREFLRAKARVERLRAKVTEAESDMADKAEAAGKALKDAADL